MAPVPATISFEVATDPMFSVDELSIVLPDFKIIESVNRLEGKRGFLPNWIDVGGKTEITAPVLAVSDFNKLITGLILVRQFFPELNDQAMRFELVADIQNVFER